MASANTSNPGQCLPSEEQGYVRVPHTQAQVQSQINRTISNLLFFYRLTHFRWIVPPNGAVNLRIRFHSSVLGKFDQTFSFEVMGTKQCYQLYCRGICCYPSISRDPKLVTLQ